MPPGFLLSNKNPWKSKGYFLDGLFEKIKGILATPQKTTPTNNKGLTRGY